MKMTIPLLLLGAVSFAETNKIWRATVAGTPPLVFTNIVEVHYDHEKAWPPCTLIRYRKNGQTNEFHAWFVEVKIDKTQ